MTTKLIIPYFLLSLLSISSLAFTPQDNFLINCGSNTNILDSGRDFIPDGTKPGSGFLSSHNSLTLTNPVQDQNSSTLYTTARVFTTASTYKFQVNKSGTHLVRLHFSPFSTGGYNLTDSKFDVLVNGVSVLTFFQTELTIVKEFILKLDDDELSLDITFDPLRKNGFAFANAIEVFSAPTDLIVDNGAKLVDTVGVHEFRNLSSKLLETVYRINVGGLKLTPFNDTLWRTWVNDEDYLVIKSSAKNVATSLVPNYQKGGASKEVAPANVYMTAKEMNRGNLTVNSEFNLTWGFPVDKGIGVKYFVRLHFCDIVSMSINQLYFNVYINGLLAYKDLDLSLLTFRVLASPFYADFVVDSVSSGVLEVSVGPSELSTSLTKNAILNGVEVMKIVDPVSRKVWSKKKNVWVLVSLIVGGTIVTCGVILAIFVLFKSRNKSRTKKQGESNGWTPLRVYAGSSRSKSSEGTHNVTRLKIPFVDLQSGTNNFDKNLIIGSGGFGIVYKAILRDNLKVAVKRGVPGSRQVNLGEWAVQWQRKGLIKRIVDPRIADQIKPESLKKYGDTAEKCLADYGVDRPTMGDVLWNLEYALQLQERGTVNATSVVHTGAPEIVAGVGSSNADGSISGTGTNQVFSQLMTNDGYRAVDTRAVVC
ncbi:protein kinase superfamily protein [Artemisia annua]|uniref:Protein kinase superfamily protein n=1 Tax=Artemisia annua TaxID=35608 RepID=A0A2U1P9D4_ARTAN|nr:protein kinase superfamily protein [Artemisia annua]